jgi:hypothetical protein
MEEYYQCQQSAEPSVPPPETNEGSMEPMSLITEYDRYRRQRITQDDGEGWASELRRYLKDIPANVTKDTEIVGWWQVCSFPHFFFAR